jgi:hypothetical protein
MNLCHLNQYNHRSLHQHLLHHLCKLHPLRNIRANFDSSVYSHRFESVFFSCDLVWSLHFYFFVCFGHSFWAWWRKYQYHDFVFWVCVIVSIVVSTPTLSYSSSLRLRNHYLSFAHISNIPNRTVWSFWARRATEAPSNLCDNNFCTCHIRQANANRSFCGKHNI